MVVHLAKGKATVADIAMEKVFPSSNSADSAAVTVKYLFFFIFVVKQVANIAEIACKFDLAIITYLFWRLNVLAVLASYFYNLMTVYFMVFLRIHFIFIFSNIVAKSAREKF